MRTEVINTAQPEAYVAGIARAAQALRDGQLVVFPTETVYGLAANAASPDAVALLRAVKARADAQPFTVHVGRRHDAARFVRSPSPVLRRLARKAWPGPVTLLAEEPEPQATEFGVGRSTEVLRHIYHEGVVGLRFPDHEVAVRLLVEAGVPVIASSANVRGHSPPYDVQAALRELDGRVALALDAGRTRYQSASSIVEVRGNTWRLVRAGAMSERTLERLAVSEILIACTGNSCRSPMAECLMRQGLAERLGLPAEQLEQAGYRVTSAGTMGGLGGPASAGALEEMDRRGLDLSGHRGQTLTVELVHRAERVYVMTMEHRRAVLDLVPGAAGRVELLDPAGPVADPIGGSSEQYRQCAEQIERAVRARLEEFLNEDRDW